MCCIYKLKINKVLFVRLFFVVVAPANPNVNYHKNNLKTKELKKRCHIIKRKSRNIYRSMALLLL